MQWPGFASLSAAWCFLLLAPLLLFYFLKLRRPKLMVPSLVLWQQVIRDQRVNSPFQKFKRNLLLLLQILLLCALVMGAMQPYWPAGTSSMQSIPVLIDVSASMAAVDRPGSSSRLDLAKEQVRKLIDNLLPEQQLCLIAVDSTARRLTDFTNNQRLLRDALNRLTVRPMPSRLDDGLRMAEALARTAAVGNVMLFSDGNLPGEIDLELPFRLNYQQLPAAGQNVGITEFNARRTRTGWELFVRLAASPGSGPEDAARLVEVELRQNDTTLQQDTVSVAAGGTARVTFSLETEVAATLEVHIRPDGSDSLSLDNTAALVLPRPRATTVYCPPEMVAWRHALSALEDLEIYPRDGVSVPETVDLRFSEQPLNTGPTAAVTLTVGVVPADIADLVDIRTQLAEVVDWNRTDPLLQHVLLGDVQIADDPVSRDGVTERDYEQAGYQVLAQGGNGPLIVAKTTPATTEWFLLFHADRSSLPYRVGFPILLANAVQRARERAGLTEARSWPTGVLPAQALEPETEYVVVTPSGRRETVRSTVSGLLTGVPANEPGRYEIRRDQQIVAELGTGLLAPLETSLVTVDTLKFPETSVTTAGEAPQTDQPLWRWFAIAGFMLLLGEWWYFQRKPG